MNFTTDTAGENCPHCQTFIPPGANVCSGCQAERHRGISTDEVKGLLVAGGIVGLIMARLLDTIVSVGFSTYFICAAAAAAGLTAVISIKSADRVRWTRVYRTRS